MRPHNGARSKEADNRQTRRAALIVARERLTGSRLGLDLPEFAFQSGTSYLMQIDDLRIYGNHVTALQC